MKRKCAWMIMAMTCTACASSGRAHVSSTSAGVPAMSISDGVLIMRSLLTTEVVLQQMHQRRTLKDLIAQPDFDSFRGQIVVIDDDHAHFRGYRLTMIAEGPTFNITLTPSAGCGAAFFASESYVIYVGRVLDCIGQ